jgi:hypothetical protein
MDQLTTVLSDYVRGAIRAALDAREVERLSGMSDEQWWAMNQPLIQELVGPARFPTLSKVGEAYKSGAIAAPDHDRSFDFGLQRVLDGIAVFIDQRRR